MASKKQQARQCQPCTGCCDGWVQMNIQGHDVYPGCPCPHSTGNGCDDYANRPVDPCHNFMCGWIIDDSPLPEWMKPSNARVIVIFNKINWNGHPVDLAVPMGRKIPPRALNWLKDFAEKHGRPLMYMEQLEVDGKFQKQQELHAFGPPDFQQQVLQWHQQGRNFW